MIRRGKVPSAVAWDAIEFCQTEENANYARFVSQARYRTGRPNINREEFEYLKKAVENERKLKRSDRMQLRCE